LEQDGFLVTGAGGFVKLRDRWSDGITLVAIEAKMRDWRRALSQASSYARYADLCYVALPTEICSRAIEEMYLFKRAGVGLISFDMRSIRVLVSARRQTNHDWQRFHVLSRLW